jgi:hypothetical protein
LTSAPRGSVPPASTVLLAILAIALGVAATLQRRIQFGC